MTTSTPPLIPQSVGPRVAARTPADWRDEPYTRFGVRPLAPTTVAGDQPFS